MKKINLFIIAIYLFCFLTGCATCPKHSIELVTDREQSGVLSVNGEKVTVYGVGSGRSPSLTAMNFSTDSEREKYSSQRAIPEAKNSLKNAVEKLLDLTVEKFNNKYPNKKIFGDTLDAWKKFTVGKAMADAKTMFYCYCKDNWIATYMATYEINVGDFKLPPETANVFISSAESLIRPESEEVKIATEQQPGGNNNRPRQ